MRLSMSSLASATARVVKATSKRTSRLAASKQAIHLTPAAVQRLKQLLEAKPDAKAIKIGVQMRGCNGLSYTMDYAQEKGRFDEEVEVDGVRMWVDSKAQLSLLGSEMDWVESRLASEFVFHNPNIKSTCGCGESFNI